MAARPQRGEGDELFPPMQTYQQALGDPNYWPHLTESGEVEARRIESMAPAHAVNALHRLNRWMEFLYGDATVKQYNEARVRLFGSMLVGALIQQALGVFYEGSFLSDSAVQRPGEPHLDDIVAGTTPLPAEAAQRILADVQGFDESLTAASIDIALALEQMAMQGQSIGKRATVARGIIRDTLKEIE